MYSRGRVVTSGELDAGWSGRGVSIPVELVRRPVSAAEICLISNTAAKPIIIDGAPSSRDAEAQLNAQPLGGRLTIAYLGDGHASWLARARAVADHLSRGRAWSGAWIAPFLIALMLAVAIIASALALGACRTARVSFCGVPVAAWLCALVAGLNAIGWSFITPPFQVPDEPAHVAYVKQLAETGSLPELTR